MFQGKKKATAKLGICLAGLLGSAVAQATYTVDVMVLYTPAVKAEQSGAMDTYISHLISTTNTAYQNSGMNIEVRLVHSSEYNKAGATAMSSNALNQFRQDQNVMNLRTEHGADIVTLLTMPSNSTCGLGYVGTGSNGRFDGYFKNWAYNFVGGSSGCDSLTFAHELGHNMGLGHSRKQNSLGGVFDYGTGYGVDRSFSTIMGYPQAFSTYTRVRQFSDASVSTCRGYPCGVDKNTANGAEAVDAINAVAPQLAAWYPTANNGGDNGGGDNGGDNSGGDNGGDNGGNNNDVIIEAEGASLFGLFRTGTDNAASAGSYIDTAFQGNYYDDTVSTHRAELKFTLEQSGIYRLKGTAYSSSNKSDSFWVQVDNGTRHLWDTLSTPSYDEMDINSRNVSDTVEVDLSRGEHYITVYAREDGTRLDQIRLVRIGDSNNGENGGGDNGGGDNGGGETGGEPSTIVIEAEDAQLYGIFRRGNDSIASAGSYIDSALNGNYYEGNAVSANRAELSFYATGAGLYSLKATSYAPTATADSFWFSINGGERHLWDTHNLAEYQEIDVNARGISETFEVELAQGDNTITFYVREDGARLDQVRFIPVDGSGGDNGGDNGGGSEPPQPATNLLKNGDFESGQTTNWKSGYSATTNITTNAYNSNYALLSKNRSQWYHGPKQDVFNAVKAGQRYLLSAQVRMSSGTGVIESRLLILDDAGHTWYKLGKVSSNSSWQELTADFTVQATGAIQSAELFFFGPGAGTEFIIDDTKLNDWQEAETPTDPNDPTDPTNPGDGGETGTISAELLAAVNEARSVGRSCGGTYYAATTAVQFHQSLQLAAQEHSDNMANNNFFSHTGQDGSDSNDRAKKHGYDKYWAGENIGAGYGSVADVMNGWLNSEGHCRHIMNSNHKDFGGASAENSNSSYRIYWTLLLGY
ncbi:carbohydrate binding domain-containing protein [Agarivorans aestuarii]|uniref:Carbohydrate binding domain-containing protein n=1 Tax=Agarivorans aestuarii TaxID=1563703 RepID=A0ABU7G3A5_9ALTE|nr:carbohydrate binding domain-containing protein [Agarivorans aestuarii]MEE1673808.1 carbohydrate binding domain-containing protein [Agarivorans aestuarii]